MRVKSPAAITCSASKMQTRLHILTKPDDEFARQIIEIPKNDPGQGMEVFDLTILDPDFDRLLEKIFTADSVIVW